MSRSRLSAYNFVTSTLLLASTIGLGFFVTPLLINWLGEEVYGAFRATTDCYSYLALLELGLEGAMLALLSQALHRVGTSEEQRLGEAAQVVSVGVRIYGLLTIGYVAIGLLLMMVLPRLVPVSPQHIADLRLGAVVATASFCLLPLNAFRTFGEVSNRGYLINILLLMQALLVTGLSLLLALDGWQIVGQFIAVAASSVVFHGALVFFARRRLRPVGKAAANVAFAAGYPPSAVAPQPAEFCHQPLWPGEPNERPNYYKLGAWSCGYSPLFPDLSPESGGAKGLTKYWQCQLAGLSRNASARRNRDL